MWAGEYRAVGTEEWKRASEKPRVMQDDAKRDCDDAHMMNVNSQYEYRVVISEDQTPIFESKPPHGWHLRWLAIMLFAPAVFAVDFEEAEDHARVPLAPRTIAAELSATVPRASFRELAWRENTVVMEYTWTDEYGRSSEGFYLADVDSDGKLAWYTHTFEPPRSHRALESAQGADAASTIAGLSHGLSEVNPLGPLVFPVKLGLVLGIKNGSAWECFSAYSPATRIGWGATAWNLVMRAGLGPAAALPAAIGAFMPKPTHDDIFWACAPGRD